LNKNEEPEVYAMTMSLLYHQEDYSKEEIDMFIYDKFEKKDVLLHDTGVAENVTIRMALCSAKYRRLTLFAIVLAVIQQLTGVNTIVSYLFPFFETIGMNSNLGSILYGIAALLGSVSSVFFYSLSFINDRRGYIIGNILLSVTMVCLALAIRFESDNATLASIFINQFIL